MPSSVSKNFLISKPPLNPVKEPFLPIILWQGIMIAIGFRLIARPAGLTAFACPAKAAASE